MISLFISDIDGCLSETYQPFELEAFQKLAMYARLAQTDALYPALSLCSGRSGPYVEAVAQALGVVHPVLFEAGGGMMSLKTSLVKWHPHFSPEIEQDIAAMRAWMIAAVQHTPLMFDYGKRTQAGIVSNDLAAVAAFAHQVSDYVAANHPNLVVFATAYSVDVVPVHTTKADGMHWLSQETQIPLHKMAYIGDSGMDCGALKTIGFPFAPANAVEAVKALRIPILPSSHIQGVLQAYEWCASWNRMKAHGRDTLPDVS